MLQPAPLWYWIRERERVRVRKESGRQPPWTEDPILSAYRFCCVRREDDRGTAWIRQNIREPYADHPLLWLMLCIARQINWPDTLTEMIGETTGPCRPSWPDSDAFSPGEITRVLRSRRERGEKIYTGAYMISAPPVRGSDKQAYIAETVIGDLWRRRVEFESSQRWDSLREIHDRISRSAGWGPFMSYQAVVDMRFTGLLEDAQDRLDWAAAGPGTLRGLNRLHGRSVDAHLSQAQALSEMREIYQVAHAETGVAMDFSDVPNALCETDKYLRVLHREGRPRAKYVAGRGA